MTLASCCCLNSRDWSPLQASSQLPLTLHPMCKDAPEPQCFDQQCLALPRQQPVPLLQYELIIFRLRPALPDPRRRQTLPRQRDVLGPFREGVPERLGLGYRGVVSASLALFRVVLAGRRAFDGYRGSCLRWREGELCRGSLERLERTLAEGVEVSDLPFFSLVGNRERSGASNEVQEVEGSFVESKHYKTY